MSDLPGEMTKQILSAPPRIIRSMRYSLTARGRSVFPSRRLPTGNNSFEKANGCMRLPAPAAGIMPHISHLQNRFVFVSFAATFHCSMIDCCLQSPFQVNGPAVSRVLGQDPFPGCARDGG